MFFAYKRSVTGLKFVVLLFFALHVSQNVLEFDIFLHSEIKRLRHQCARLINRTLCFSFSPRSSSSSLNQWNMFSKESTSVSIVFEQTVLTRAVANM